MWCFKNVIFGVILALFSCQVDSSEQIVGNKPEVSEEGSGMELTVLSYNVHHCNPPSKPGVIDLDAVANDFKKIVKQLLLDFRRLMCLQSALVKTWI